MRVEYLLNEKQKNLDWESCVPTLTSCIAENSPLSLGVDKTWIGSSDRIIGPDHRIGSSGRKNNNTKSNNKIKQKKKNHQTRT